MHVRPSVGVCGSRVVAREAAVRRLLSEAKGVKWDLSAAHRSKECITESHVSAARSVV